MKTVLILVLLAAAPAWAQAPACPFDSQTPKLVVRLYFGQSIKGAGLVSRRAWQRFVAEQVTQALPAGFTLYDAAGQYREPMPGGIGHEPTEVIEAVAEDTPAFRARVAGLADAYRIRFRQGTVGIVSQLACAAF